MMRPPVRSRPGHRQRHLPGEPADGGQHPGHGGVGDQAVPVPSGQGVVGQRDHGVGDQGGQPAAPGTPPPGRPVGAQRADHQGTEHDHVLQGADRAEQDGRQQAEQGQGRAARGGHPEPGRLPGRPPGPPQAGPPDRQVRQLRDGRQRAGRAGSRDPKSEHPQEHALRPARGLLPARPVRRPRTGSPRPSAAVGDPGHAPRSSPAPPSPGRRRSRTRPAGATAARAAGRPAASSTRSRRKARSRALPRVWRRRISRRPLWRRRCTRRRDRHSLAGLANRARRTTRPGGRRRPAGPAAPG